jgi:hypothetical protein
VMSVGGMTLPTNVMDAAPNAVTFSARRVNMTPVGQL